MEFSLGRFITGALVSALLTIGGVWFVVDIAIRGVEKSVDVTNARISDGNTLLTEFKTEYRDDKNKLDKKLDTIEEKISSIKEVMATQQDLQNLEVKMAAEFKATRELLKKINFDVDHFNKSQRLLLLVSEVQNISNQNKIKLADLEKHFLSSGIEADGLVSINLDTPSPIFPEDLDTVAFYQENGFFDYESPILAGKVVENLTDENLDLNQIGYRGFIIVVSRSELSHLSFKDFEKLMSDSKMKFGVAMDGDVKKPFPIEEIHYFRK